MSQIDYHRAAHQHISNIKLGQKSQPAIKSQQRQEILEISKHLSLALSSKSDSQANVYLTTAYRRLNRLVKARL